MPIQEYLDKIGLEHLVQNLKQINVRVAEQDLTEEQQTQVRTNIGAAAVEDIPTKVSDLTNDTGFITSATMTILSYGSSTWQDFITAYNTNNLVYCRASSNSNPASGSQTRLAFMAYVNNATNPTEVEFQYYRSVSSHSASQQGDQVFVYKLTKTDGWTVTTREASVKVVAGTGLSSSYSNNTLTLSANIPANISTFTNDAGYQTASDVEASIVSTSLYGVCSTGQAVETKEVSIPEITELYEGLSIRVKFANGNTKSSPSLQVNQLTAYPIVLRIGTPASSANQSSWYAGAVISFTYDGSVWVMNDYNNSTYSSMSQEEMETGTATTGRTITAQKLKQAVLYHGKDIDVATTSANGLMSATDKANLDAVVADYSSALTALGV